MTSQELCIYPNCANLHCPNKLTDFELSKKTRYKQNRYVFCKPCRVSWARGKTLFWKCGDCEEVLTSTNSLLHKKYCSLKCRYGAHNKKMFRTEKKCLMCGKIFMTSWGKYCSQICSNRYQRMKRKNVRLCLIPPL